MRSRNFPVLMDIESSGPFHQAFRTMQRLLFMGVLLAVSALPLTARQADGLGAAAAVSQGSAAARPVLPSSRMLEDRPILYAVREHATVYSHPDSSQAYVQLKLREPVYEMGREGAWHQVRTFDGAQGYIHHSAVSNVWIRVSKSKRTLYLYRGVDLVKKIPVDLGYNFFADKERRGGPNEPDHWRTPDGVFFVAQKNPHSQFYKAFVLNYPTAEDADRGLRQGLISKAEHAAIVRAEHTFQIPPMHTALGGWIEIHGAGTGARSNWTQGCIAIQNASLDAIWDLVAVGTPVLVEP